MYGILNPLTRDWTDGLLSNIFREINKVTDKCNERRYILFDGDVDALWIENMNSVMDDNKLLTLANGERIRLQPICALLFEVGDLQYASPATVSRAGMVYIDPKNLGYRPYWDKWLSFRTHLPEREYLNKLFNQYVAEIMSYIFTGFISDNELQKPLKMIIHQTDLNMITQLCYILDGTYPQSVFKYPLPDTPVAEKVLHSVFLQAIYCSLGATLIEESKIRFDLFVKKLSKLEQFVDSVERNCPAGLIPITWPTLYDYFFDSFSDKDWKSWNSLVPAYVHDRSVKFGDILVPTVDTVKTCWILRVMNELRQPVVLIGETGTFLLISYWFFTLFF